MGGRPPACRTGARVKARQWGMPMARKRRWQARAAFQEPQHVFLDRGLQDFVSARGMVRRQHGNVFAPIMTVNDATRTPLKATHTTHKGWLKRTGTRTLRHRPH